MTENKKPNAKTVPGICVTTAQKGFRRGGREWTGTTDVALADLSEEQIKQIKTEPVLVVQDIELSSAQEEA